VVKLVGRVEVVNKEEVHTGDVKVGVVSKVEVGKEV
jgi:hypothetical protein